MGIITIIIGIILTLAAGGFLIWFWARIPENLSEWYGVPVIIMVTVLVVGIWVALILPMFLV